MLVCFHYLSLLYHVSDLPFLSEGHPLASGFSLRDGSVKVTCPTVSPGDTYIIVCELLLPAQYTFLDLMLIIALLQQ